MDLLLVDNSNIFIGLKNRYGNNQSVRFNYGNFLKLIKSNCLKKIIVGSIPPKEDSFWKAMELKGFDVYTYERTRSGEKGVDSKIIVEGVDFINKYGGKNTTIYLMSGDLDMKPLIEKAIEEDCNVIIYSWRDSLNKEYIYGNLKNRIKIVYLDDFIGDIAFVLNKNKAESEGKNFSNNSSDEIIVNLMGELIEKYPVASTVVGATILGGLAYAAWKIYMDDSL